MNQEKTLATKDAIKQIVKRMNLLFGIIKPINNCSDVLWKFFELQESNNFLWWNKISFISLSNKFFFLVSISKGMLLCCPERCTNPLNPVHGKSCLIRMMLQQHTHTHREGRVKRETEIRSKKKYIYDKNVTNIISTSRKKKSMKINESRKNFTNQRWWNAMPHSNNVVTPHTQMR